MQAFFEVFLIIVCNALKVSELNTKINSNNMHNPSKQRAYLPLTDRSTKTKGNN
jgi:hypothetical protein